MGRNYHIVLKFLMLLLLLSSRNESPVRAENLSTQTWVGSKYQIECTMCSACDNPCNTPSPPPPSPPPPTTTANSPPPPSPPIYYYTPPPPQPIYTYYSPPPPGGGGYYKPPPTPAYPTGPAPPPPNPIVPYFPYYYYNPPLPSLSPPLKNIPSSLLKAKNNVSRFTDLRAMRESVNPGGSDNFVDFRKCPC